MDFNDLPYIYLEKICIVFSSCTSSTSSNVNEYIILTISIFGGGLVSLFTTYSIYWYQEKHKNKYDFLDDLILIKNILDQKKSNFESCAFSISMIKPYSKKKLYKKKLYNEIENVLHTQVNRQTTEQDVQKIIQKIEKLIEEI